jgi:hypothetical protein
MLVIFNKLFSLANHVNAAAPKIYAVTGTEFATVRLSFEGCLEANEAEKLV